MIEFPAPLGLPADISFPSFRYKPWERLEIGLSIMASQRMEYDNLTWNLPGSSPVEKYSWETLHDIGVNISDAESLGWDESQWDCFANHFDDYSWKELAEEGVQQYWQTLGWTRQMWLNQTAGPDSEEKGWADLTEVEKAAAGALCFFEYTWDMDLTLPKWQFWLDNPVQLTTNESGSDTVAPDPTNIDANGQLTNPSDSSVAANTLGAVSVLSYPALCAALLALFIR